MKEKSRVMLAQKYDEKKVIFPAYIQIKYDGIRCRAVIKNGDVKLWTRDNKPILSMDHIIDALKGVEDCELDGELYAHNVPFQTLNGIIRRQYHNEESLIVSYNVYDVVSDEGYSRRLVKLQSILDKGVTQAKPPIQLVATFLASKHEEVLAWHGRFVAEGYEGAMVRTKLREKKTGKMVDVGYESEARTGNRRSWSLVKFKEFNDAEFEIIGFEEEYDLAKNPKGRLGAFVLRLSDDKTFKASGISDEIKVHAWNNPSEYLNKYATIKYFGVSEDGIPRFPNFVGIRWDKD